MSSLDNINSYLANDPALEMRVKKTLQKCFNELSFSVSLPIAPVDGGSGANLSATGGASEVVMQETPGGDFTVRQLAAADISEGATGTGNILLSTAVYADPQFFTPAAAGTVAPTATGSSIVCFINPAGTIATMTLTLPTGAYKGQRLTANFTQIVTTLTVTNTNTDTKGLAQPTAATTTSAFEWAWDSASGKWNRIR